MVPAAAAPRQCRFCLEPTNTAADPLIEPCPCRGSVQFVHMGCLRRWAAQNPAANAKVCSICGDAFYDWVFPPFEIVPELGPREEWLLRHLGSIGWLSQQLFLFEMWTRHGRAELSHEIIAANTAGSIILYHIFLLVVLLHYVQVKSIGRYVRLARQGTLPTMLLVHVTLLFSMAENRTFIVTAPIYYLSNCYWSEHIRILRSVNRGLIARGN